MRQVAVEVFLLSGYTANGYIDFGTTSGGATAVTSTIYNDALASDWSDWTWGSVGQEILAIPLLSK